jgi:hypothetical protein
MAEIELPKLDELEELKAKTFTKRVALTTALYAVVLAIASLGGTNAMKHMLLSQQQASDQWAFYQAKVIREHQYRIQTLRLDADLAERGPTMKREVRQKFEELQAKLADEEKRYNTEKQEALLKAKELEQDRDLHRTKDPYFDYAEVLLQIAIVMASIAILATSRPLYIFSLGLAILGAFLTLNGFLLFMRIPFLHSGH